MGVRVPAAVESPVVASEGEVSVGTVCMSPVADMLVMWLIHGLATVLVIVVGYPVYRLVRKRRLS